MNAAAVTAAAAVIAALGPILTAIIGYALKRKVEAVHVLVNARMERVSRLLTEALADNVRLKDQAGESPGPPVTGPRP